MGICIYCGHLQLLCCYHSSQNYASNACAGGTRINRCWRIITCHRCKSHADSTFTCLMDANVAASCDSGCDCRLHGSMCLHHHVLALPLLFHSLHLCCYFLLYDKLPHPLATMMLVVLLSAALAMLFARAVALPTITAKGAKFFTSEGDQFYIKGTRHIITTEATFSLTQKRCCLPTYPRRSSRPARPVQTRCKPDERAWCKLDPRLPR